MPETATATAVRAAPIGFATMIAVRPENAVLTAVIPPLMANRRDGQSLNRVEKHDQNESPL
jgi:hypothetical protein